MALFKAVTFLRLVFSIIGTGSLNYEKCVCNRGNEFVNRGLCYINL